MLGNEIPSIDTQVEKSGVKSAYEWWKVKDPSERRSCLRRTPPSAKGVAVTDREVEEDPYLVNLFNFMGSDIPVSKVQGDNSDRRQREREGSRIAKRPREEILARTFSCVEVEMESEAIQIRDMVRKLSELSKAVASRIRDTPNTKTEIRKRLSENSADI